jgi:hypothetical protein
LNSKEKGNIGESKVLCEFVKRGIQVSIPYGDNARYDLIADFRGRLNKIQVKYCDQLTDNDSIILPCASSTNHTTNKHYTTYENDVDYFAFYIPKWDMSLLVPIEEIGTKKSITVRKTPTKSNQKSSIHLVQDYSFDKALCVETLHGEPKSI